MGASGQASSAGSSLLPVVCLRKVQFALMAAIYRAAKTMPRCGIGGPSGQYPAPPAAPYNTLILGPRVQTQPEPALAIELDLHPGQTLKAVIPFAGPALAIPGQIPHDRLALTKAAPCHPHQKKLDRHSTPELDAVVRAVSQIRPPEPQRTQEQQGQQQPA